MKPFRLLALAALMGIPLTANAQEAQGYAPAAAAEGDILETAGAAGSFTTLARAIDIAGLTETLKGRGRSPSLPPPTRPSPRSRRRRWTRC